MTIEYRKSMDSDYNQIEDLLKKYSEAYIPPFTEQERIDEINHIKNGKAFCLVAVDNDKIVGYLVWKKYKENSKYGYICNLLVEPKYRRKGISTKIRKLAFTDMEQDGFNGVYYTTWDKNIGMIESSKKLGMEVEDCYLDEEFRGPEGKTYLFKKDFSS